MHKIAKTKLEQWRQANEISYLELADRLGVSRSSAYRLCHDQQGISAKTALAIETITNRWLTGATYRLPPDHVDQLQRAG